MDKDIQEIVQAIHSRPRRVVIVTAGAGSQALAWLLGVAGASRTLIEALIPYDAAASSAFLGRRPKQYAAAVTARWMAGRALTYAQLLRQDEEPVVGLACTATIATDRPKRGRHRAFICTWQAEQIHTYHLQLDKGARDRLAEEDLVSRLMLNALASACSLSPALSLPLGSGDQYKQVHINLADYAERLHRREIPYFCVQADGQVSRKWPRPVALLAGSFNPLHDGHLQLAQTVNASLGLPIIFELSADNVDKPPLPSAVVLSRLAQFAGRWPVVADNAPTFVEKARLFPGTTFITGYDTARRVLQRRYYDDDEAEMRAALTEIQDQNCRFVVAGRVDDAGQFHTAAELAVPPSFADLFRPLPDFRRDISSTELRAAGERGNR